MASEAWSARWHLCGEPPAAIMRAMGNVLIVVALGIVFAILMAGLVVMSLGGAIDKQWSNRLMRYRVLAQAVAILVVLTVLYFSQH